MIVVVGDKDDLGNAFGINLIQMMTNPVSRLCILKGGIDAIKIESP